ncbi:MAG: hypothetical protein LAP38_10185 [Acidobacteriia bacterium]|nr:hypothetical protein [Terriglobia bacterium]
MIAKSAVILLLVVGASFLLSAHDVISTKITWNREISRIVYKRCASCHRDGGSASDIKLMTYQDARPWAKAIKEEVLERRMPPFAAVKGFGEVQDQEALTQEEMHLIADWVEGGSPEGDDPSLLPKPPVFDSAEKGVAANVKAAATSASAKPGTEIIADGSLTLKAPLTLIGARAGAMTEGSSVQAVAQMPDGEIRPLIWIYDYKPKYDRAYYFEKPLTFPAGTKIEVYPAGGGTLALLAKK